MYTNLNLYLLRKECFSFNFIVFVKNCKIKFKIKLMLLSFIGGFTLLIQQNGNTTKEAPS